MALSEVEAFMARKDLRCVDGWTVFASPTKLDKGHERRYVHAMFYWGKTVQRFLAWARRHGAHESYIAQHRRAWWSVGLRAPAPILCTYVARRAPAFVRNVVKARHINIAHGLYPREPLNDGALTAILAYLRRHMSTTGGRTYAGGLVKFEPKELERILLPRIVDIHSYLAESESRQRAACQRRHEGSQGERDTLAYSRSGTRSLLRRDAVGRHSS